jgi:holo-[acyl-carrier protein] synthase
MAIFCGVDIVEIDRIRKSFETNGIDFRDRVFTTVEIGYCENRKAARFESYAARFAAKEAVSKAFGTGIGNVGWKDIEVLNDGNGKPYVVLSDNARNIFNRMKGLGISLSLSHCKHYAVAYAVIETCGGGSSDECNA